LRVDRYVGEDRQAHLLSVFGNDSDVGAITAAIHEKATFTLTFPDRSSKEVSLGDHASCYKGAVTLPDRKHPVRHLLAVSEQLHTNGTIGRTILLRYQRDQAWATLVSFLGLPAEPQWADHVLSVIESEDRLHELDGIGCDPVLISATTEEVLEWIGDGLSSQTLRLPETNGPVCWPRFSLKSLLDSTGSPAQRLTVGSTATTRRGQRGSWIAAAARIAARTRRWSQSRTPFWCFGPSIRPGVHASSRQGWRCYNQTSSGLQLAHSAIS
jgi:hypothetical protein